MIIEKNNNNNIRSNNNKSEHFLHLNLMFPYTVEGTSDYRIRNIGN